MFGKSLLVALIAANLFIAPASASERLVTGGVVRGQSLPDGGEIFRAIPYAAPPQGDLRWKAPAPLTPWLGVRDVTKTPPPCLQRSYGWNAADAAASSEDCLYLAVDAPAHRPTDRLPVMVFIHGGANRAGSGTGFAESSMANSGVVLVSIQYRLGTFGFISSGALTAESPEHASGNYGLMDQIAALKWVKENIARFGGDPNNVTLFGHSAGAQDVGLLMLSPLAHGLFQKAIMESGTPGFGVPPRSLAENEQLGRDLAKLMNLPDGPAGLAALRTAPGDEILDATDKLLPPGNVDPSFIWLQAVVDGWVLPQSPTDVLAAGQQAPVPLIIGNSVREFTMDAAKTSPRQWIDDNFGVHAGIAMTFYGLNPGQTPYDNPLFGNLSDRLSADVIFRGPARLVAERQLALTPKVWRYQLDVAKPGLPQPAIHGSELPFLFDTPPAGIGPGAWPPLRAYWTNFAKTGDPNGPGLAHWPQLGHAKSFMEFTPHGPHVGTNLCGEICSFLRRP